MPKGRVGWAIACTACLCLPVAHAASSQPASSPASAPTTSTAPAGGKDLSQLGLREDRGKGLPTLSDGDSGGLLGQMVACVLVILVLGGAAVFVAKRYLPRVRPGGGQRIRVVDSAYLGPRKQLHVLEVGGQRFLVASCRDRVTMISELTSSFSEVYEEKKAQADGGPPPAGIEKETGG
ncbi:MAG TPA: flagellar biosynthetic protein FliO [Phycisphaerae bacterium]|nr:flagellar biosynthetic protein FliO [Phycisphaerae bacterium]